MTELTLDITGTKTGPIRIALGRGLVLLGLSILAVGICWITPNPNTASQPGVRMVLPDFPLGMLSEPQEMSPGEKLLLPSDTEIVRKAYFSTKGDRITVSIVLAGGEKRSIHRPEVCLPAQGWYMRKGQTVNIPMKDGGNLEAMKLDLQREVDFGNGRKNQMRAVFLYWFIGKDTTTPHHWKRLFLTSWDRVFRQINHRWAYVSVMSVVTQGYVLNGKDEAQTLDMLKSFTSEIAPSFLLPRESP
ncbi:MAG: EpsI family protein [Candidatus Methylacidiphilales bacterium]|nr:EpsI family protein [Candidatus Methylacidiphilales bacterium]